MFPKAGFTDIGNTVLLTSKLREVHSCTAHDIVQLGVYTELNISNVGKLQFLDDKEIKIKLCWLLVISTGGEAQLYTDEWTCLSIRAWSDYRAQSSPSNGLSAALDWRPVTRASGPLPIANCFVMAVKLTQPSSS